MPVRNYDRSDPNRVVKNIARVLQKQDMALLSHDAYKFLITHCGFIAHYDHRGFVEEYREDLPGFIGQFLDRKAPGWQWFLDSPHSYLYDTSYKGKVLADIIRELIPLFESAREPVEASHRDREQAEKQNILEALASELGYRLVKES